MLNPDYYSITLTTAVALCVVSVFCLVIRRLRLSAFTSIGALVFTLLSFILHRVLDHSSGKEVPLNSYQFITQHPAFLVVGSFAILLLALAFRLRTSQDKVGS